MAGVSCWQNMGCGKENDCPAYPNRGFDCWNVEGTLCRGEKQGTYEQKVQHCRQRCPFYAGVMSGEIRVT